MTKKKKIMIPSSLNYHKATSVENAIQLLGQFGPDAKLIAGGHSLLPAIKLRLNQPEHLIDIGRIAGLKMIQTVGGKVVIGSACTHDQLANAVAFRGALSMFRDAAAKIGDIQVRNMGTIGGSLAHADPAADWPAVILASNATLTIRGAARSREVSASDFFTGFFTTDLQEDEIIETIQVPIPGTNSKSSYLKFEQPASRFAIVGCAVLIDVSGGICDDIRIAFTGVSDMAFRDGGLEQALRGKALSEDNISASCELAANDAIVQSDHYASENYRKHLAKVYAKRAIKKAME